MLDPLSFGVGFLAGILFFWLIGRFRPLWRQWREAASEQRQAAQLKRTSGMEDNHRRLQL